MRDGLIFTGVAFELATAVLAGQYFGAQLDAKFGTDGTYENYLTLALFLGWATHFWYLIRIYLKKQNAADENDSN